MTAIYAEAAPASQFRLVRALYGRRISVHVDVDPEILGGLVVRVGGEVIDGSISGRLRGAEQALPG